MNSNLRLAFVDHDAAKYAVEHWHYSKRMPSGKLVKIGVWEHDNFIGVVLFGGGATRALVKQYSIQPWEGCELVRIALSKHESTVTRIVSIALRMLKRFCPGLKLVVSFADPEQSHVGGIYQAGNWIYTGASHAADEYIVNGKRMHGRSFRSKYKGLEHDPRVVTVKGSSKHRYLMALDAEMGERIKQLSKTYPKRTKQETGATSATSAVTTPTRPLQSRTKSKQRAGGKR